MFCLIYILNLTYNISTKFLKSYILQITFNKYIIISKKINDLNHLPTYLDILSHFVYKKFSLKCRLFLYKLCLIHTRFSTSKPLNIYFSCQIKWHNIFYVRYFSYCQINLTLKVNLFKPYKWKILFNSLINCKET